MLDLFMLARLLVAKSPAAGFSIQLFSSLWLEGGSIDGL
jgi:hypothetical protein